MGLLSLYGRCGVFAAILLASPTVLVAQPAAEYEVKAALLYKFAGFVQWPDDAGGPICIGVLGHEPFGPALDEAVRGKTVNGRAFVVKRSRNTQDLASCKIVFISSSEHKRLRPILNALSTGVLTVGDMPDFCSEGGVVGFELEDRRVRLQINLEAAQRERLQVSSKLLSLAKVVNDAGR